MRDSLDRSIDLTKIGGMEGMDVVGDRLPMVDIGVWEALVPPMGRDGLV
jgi:hypothetical protein